MRLRLLAISFSFYLLGAPALAGDWGYDDPQVPVVEPMRAVALPMTPPGAKPTKPGQAKPATAKPIQATAVPAGITKPVPAKPVIPKTGTARGAAPGVVKGTAPQQLADPTQQAAESWVQLFELVAESPLSNEQKQHIRDFELERSKTGPTGASELKAIQIYWPKVKAYLARHSDQMPHYSAFFRALLRWRERALSTPDKAALPTSAREKEIIAEILGPVRFALVGDPPLTEDAVNAYSDMACFIYEQQNPGKTIDAGDNREMFAAVVTEKYRNAPTQKDRQAMIGFDVSWSRFKILWNGADERVKKILLAQLVQTGANSAAKQVDDPLLNAILKNW